MNKLFLIALVVLVLSMGLRDRLGDSALAIGIGIGIAFIVVGLFQLYGRRA